ncbi:hypothetical protein B0H10DRAFT_14054 [Mycena sp. CBHHK59/15]|nr:hypothetical protein B0H10DRAFT_14054 [Mycena sp. CBHHK59/15]
MAETRLFYFQMSRIVTVSPEIALYILRLCGPADLLQMYRVSKGFNLLLKDHPSCWAAARTVLSTVPAPPVGIHESVYAQYLFGGGTCAVCGKYAADLPVCFALRFRACSKTCRERIFSHRAAAIIRVPENHNLHRSAAWAPFHRVSGKRIYSQAELQACKELYSESKSRDSPQAFKTIHIAALESCRSSMECFDALRAWRGRYEVQIKQTEKFNKAFVKELADKQQINFKRLLSSPSIICHLDAFNQSCTQLDEMAWNTMKRIVFPDLLRRRLNPPRPQPSVVICRPEIGKLLCPECPAHYTRTYSKRGLSNHLADSQKHITRSRKHAKKWRESSGTDHSTIPRSRAP